MRPPLNLPRVHIISFDTGRWPVEGDGWLAIYVTLAAGRAGARGRFEWQVSGSGRWWGTNFRQLQAQVNTPVLSTRLMSFALLTIGKAIRNHARH